MEDKTPAPGQSRTLHQQFYQFAYSQTAEHFYILFNSANHPQLPQHYYALEPEQQYTGLLLDLLEGYNDQSIPVMPYLVEINRDTLEQNPFIDWLFSTPETRDSFFALSSDFDLNTVVAQQLNNLTLYLWENHEQTLSQYSHEITEQIIDQGLKKAQALGFTLTSSICQCVSLFLDYSPVFYRHKDIQSLWAQPASEYEQLLALSEKITPQQWQQMTQQSDMDDWLNIPQNPIAIILQTQK